MSKKKEEGKNIKLAGLFILLVFGLIVFSLLIKLIFVFRQSKFDGVHKFNVAFVTTERVDVVSFSPSLRLISVLKIDQKIDKNSLSKELEIPIDAVVFSKKEITDKNIPTILLESILPLGNSFEKMTIVDAVRVFLFSRGISENSIYQRKISKDLNQSQKTTLISLTFTDPTIYQENQSIEIINSTDVYGLGARLASFITNIGGNVILVTSPQSLRSKSEIVYSGQISYTVRKLSDILNFPLEKSDKSGIADVIIIIGKDSLEKLNF